MQIKEFSQTENKDYWVGFEFFQEMQDRRGDMSLVYKRAVRAVKAR